MTSISPAELARFNISYPARSITRDDAIQSAIRLLQSPFETKQPVQTLTEIGNAISDCTRWLTDHRCDTEVLALLCGLYVRKIETVRLDCGEDLQAIEGALEALTPFFQDQTINQLGCSSHAFIKILFLKISRIDPCDIELAANVQHTALFIRNLIHLLKQEHYLAQASIDIKELFTMLIATSAMHSSIIIASNCSRPVVLEAFDFTTEIFALYEALFKDRLWAIPTKYFDGCFGIALHCLNPHWMQHIVNERWRSFTVVADRLLSQHDLDDDVKNMRKFRDQLLSIQAAQALWNGSF